MARERILFLFVDGVGLAAASPANPLATLPTPALRALLGGPLTVESLGRRDGFLLSAIDAGLGVPGRPQSATGQTALFTGQNGAVLLGHHSTAFPGPQLRALLAEHSIFRRAAAAGRAVTFANPFNPGYWQALEEGRRKASASTLALRAAGVPFRNLEDLRRGEAVTWDVRRDLFARAVDASLPAVSEAQAGSDLARIGGAHDLTLYETFLTDLAGHDRFGLEVPDAVERVDGLLGGVLASRPEDLTVVLTSDHGNIEESGHSVHTTNPVPLLVVGRAAPAFADVRSILEVGERMLAVLGVPGETPRESSVSS